jgi:hypothetical protein
MHTIFLSDGTIAAMLYRFHAKCLTLFDLKNKPSHNFGCVWMVDVSVSVSVSVSF